MTPLLSPLCTVTDMCVDLACCLDTLEQDLVVVVQYPYHYSTDYAWYLVLRAHLSHLISKLTQIDKVSLRSPGNNKHFGIRYLSIRLFEQKLAFFQNKTNILDDIFVEI